MAPRAYRVTAMVEVYTDVPAQSEGEAVAEAMARRFYQGCAPDPGGAWRYSGVRPVLREVRQSPGGRTMFRAWARKHHTC